jgi:hypothetical protein
MPEIKNTFLFWLKLLETESRFRWDLIVEFVSADREHGLFLVCFVSSRLLPFIAAFHFVPFCGLARRVSLVEVYQRFRSGLRLVKMCGAGAVLFFLLSKDGSRI